MNRSRFWIALYASLVIVVGLTIVATARHLPTWVRAHFADVLVCIAIYLAAAFVMPRTKPMRIALATFVFATCVELTQLYHAPWLDRFRATLVGELTIGSSFGVLDIVCYAIGTFAATVFDICVLLRFHRTDAAR